MLTNKESNETLTEVKIYGESRPYDWVVDPKTDSQLFSDFPQTVLTKMGQEALALHAHHFTIATDTYEESSLLSDFFKVLAVDTHEGTEFVLAVEGRDYPIAGVMNHPET